MVKSGFRSCPRQCLFVCFFLFCTTENIRGAPEVILKKMSCVNQLRFEQCVLSGTMKAEPPVIVSSLESRKIIVVVVKLLLKFHEDRE